MKISEKFEKYLITTGCDNLGSKEKYPISNKITVDFISLIFTLRARRRLSYAALLRARSKKKLRLHP
jgi:hypothetical protein